jgi:hypothetical protein
LFCFVCLNSENFGADSQRQAAEHSLAGGEKKRTIIFVVYILQSIAVNDVGKMFVDFALLENTFRSATSTAAASENKKGPKHASVLAPKRSQVGLRLLFSLVISRLLSSFMWCMFTLTAILIFSLVISHLL